MAEDKDTFYFSHDYNAREDEKIKELIYQNGMIGYGIYWSIIEMLYQNANALRTNYKRIAFDLHQSTSEIVESVITEFDLFSFSEDGEYFYSKSIQRRLEKREAKSKKARESAMNRWNKSERNANALRTQSDSNAIKERKVKESKVNILLEKETKEGERFQSNENNLVNTQEESSKKVAPKKVSFKPPDVSEVQSYCTGRQNGIDAQEFCDFYASKGWMVGKNKMKDWQACVRTWEKYKQKNGTTTNGNNSGKISGRATISSDYIHPEFT